MDDVYHPGQLGAPFTERAFRGSASFWRTTVCRETWSMDEPPLGVRKENRLATDLRCRMNMARRR